MVDASVTASLTKDMIRKNWISLKNKLGRKNNNRNELAHFTIDKNASGVFCLMPYQSLTKQMAEQMKVDNLDLPINRPKLLKPNDIWQRAKAFEKTSKDVKEFNRSLGFEMHEVSKHIGSLKKLDRDYIRSLISNRNSQS
ncbi:MAG: hypothetical protein ABJN69_03085 [Hellea sp.]